jgi:predicted MPP superfamily phosphohydrolase
MKRRLISLLLAFVAIGGTAAVAETADLQVTEIWPGQEGDDLTEDWFEIVNNGDTAWVSGVNDDLYYDDDSADTSKAALILGISDIQPGEAVVVVVADDASCTDDVGTVWSSVIDMSDVQVGWTDGSGLGDGGDAVTLWEGDEQIDYAEYPDTGDHDGQSYDVVHALFSVAGTHGAVATTDLGGDSGDTPAVASPGIFGEASLDLTPTVTIDFPADAEVYAYDTAVVRVEVTQSNIAGGVNYINETLGTTQTVDAVSAFVSLVEGANTLTVSGTNELGEAVSDSVSVVRASNTESNHVALAAIGSLALSSGSEIVAFDATTGTAFVTTPEDGLVIVDLSDPSYPVEVGSVLTNELINSVAVYNGLVAVAIESGSSAAGTVAFLHANGEEINRVTVGILPDNVEFSPDGTRVLTADEAESADHEDFGAGSISVIQVNNVTDATVSVLGFEAFDSQVTALRAAGVRIFPGRLPSVDFEPEFVAISDDSTKALVTLQEANAMAVVDLSVPEITEIVPLGLKEWSHYQMDASDKDDGIHLASYPFSGMYMPDTVVSYAVNGTSYYVIANEGDSRDLDDADEIRLEDVTLDPIAFPTAATLQSRDWAGRLKISQVDADTDGDGDYDVVYAYGARSFAILDEDGAMVYESADEFETYLAENVPELHNVNDCNADEFDARSDDKGCEPEAAEVGVINGVTYAFIGLERVGGVMVYNVSNPTHPAFVEFVRLDGDVAPEGFDFVSAENSPSGSPLLLVANEDSHTLTVYEIEIDASAETDAGTSIEWLAAYGLTRVDDGLDSDGDGLTTAEEYTVDTDPTDSDCDGDFILDGDEDDDADGLTTVEELAANTDPALADTDYDLLLDGYEISNSLDAGTAQSIESDADGDGHSDIEEYFTGTDPKDGNDYFGLQTAVSNGNVSIRFPAAAGCQYVLQTSDNLSVWKNSTLDDGSGIFSAAATNACEFFRIDSAVDNGAPVAKICVISDPHYMEPSLLENGSNTYFEAYLEEDRKLIEESDEILASVLASIVEEAPDVLLIPGDLTKDGELVSHQALSNFFADVEAEGIHVVICPGNHDINNTNAVKYVGTDSYEWVDSITAAQFVANYAHCGYGDAIHSDTNSLSFVVEPVDGLWVLSVDSCLYEPTQITAGNVSDETLRWINEILEEAAESNKTVLAMMHHGVVPHYAYQTALFPEYVVSNYEEVQAALIDGNVGAVFTGHYHANDIVRDDTGHLFDIETGSTVTWPCPYRVLFMTADGGLNVGTKYVEKVEGIDNFQTYAYDYLTNGLTTVSYNMLIYGYGVDAPSAAALTPAMVESFAAHYAGDEGEPSAYVQYMIGVLMNSTNTLEYLMGATMQSIWNDPAPADNHVLLDLKNGGAVTK